MKQSCPDWLVQIPLDDLLALRKQAQGDEEVKQEIAQLRREMEGLSRLLHESFAVIGELRREVKGR